MLCKDRLFSGNITFKGA